MNKLTAVVMIGVVSASGCSSASVTAKPDATAKPDVTAKPGATVQTSKRVQTRANFQVGFDYTQNSHLAEGGNATAIASAKGLVTALNAPQNVHLMGFGAKDPEPSPGVYSWSSLDARVEVMGDTVPVSQRMITLCTAPGWMKIGGENQEWNMEDAVGPAYYQDFAKLAAQVAERYDGTHRGANGQLLPKVDYFDVWNEMKGFWDASANRWDYEGYTEMYNDVYTAIKKVRPDAQIGGPYSPLRAEAPDRKSDTSRISGIYGVVDQGALDVVTYWLQHKAGAQFISVDGGPALSAVSWQTAAQGFADGSYFSDVAAWVHDLSPSLYPGVQNLPLRWVEFYPAVNGATGQNAVAIDLANIIDAGLSGINDMYLWEPEGDAQGNGESTGEPVWTDTANAGGGRPTGFYAALKELHDNFPPRTPVHAAKVTGPIVALANQHNVLLVSESAHTLTVSVNGTLSTLSPYEVTVVPDRS